MRDLDDLEATWALLEERADAYALPDLTSSAVQARAGQRAHRRRTGLAIAASVAGVGITCAAIVASSVATPSHRSSAPLSTAPVSALEQPQQSSPVRNWPTLPDNGHYLFVFDRLPGTTVTSIIGVGNAANPGGKPAYQEVQTIGRNGGLVFKVNATGAWHPIGGTPVAVNGTRGFYGTFLLHPEIPGHPVPPRVALAWQYAPDSWVTVASTQSPIPVATAQRIAGLVRIGTGEPIPDPPPGS